jgi:hypothetical protein
MREFSRWPKPGEDLCGSGQLKSTTRLGRGRPAARDDVAAVDQNGRRRVSTDELFDLDRDSR